MVELIEEYLLSEQAERDVAAALVENDIAGAAWGGVFTLPDRGHLVALYPSGEEIGVYYRPEGDRYIVTDLGEAVRAWRLRTGSIWQPCEAAYEHINRALAPLHDVSVTDAMIWHAGAMLRIGVPAADLPPAILRVMLAAHRVARLPVRGEPPVFMDIVRQARRDLADQGVEVDASALLAEDAEDAEGGRRA
jgi:hypothetical protein